MFQQVEEDVCARTFVNKWMDTVLLVHTGLRRLIKGSATLALEPPIF